MKIPNAENLGKIKIKKPIIPTFGDKTQGKSILLEMKDGTIGEYKNEGYFEFINKYENKEIAAASWIKTNNPMEDFNLMYKKSKSLLPYIQSNYPNVKFIYLGYL